MLNYIVKEKNVIVAVECLQLQLMQENVLIVNMKCKDLEKKDILKSLLEKGGKK